MALEIMDTINDAITVHTMTAVSSRLAVDIGPGLANTAGSGQQ